MTPIKTHLIAALFAVATTSAFAHEYSVGTLSIDHPHSFATPPSAKSGAGYLTITNTGDAPDRLVGVKADFARTMIHESEMMDGMMTMRPQSGGVVIPAGETVSFAPGGLHIMFMDLSAPLKEGEKNAATLVFESAGELAVDFSVEKRSTKEADHSGHGTHSGHSN